MSGVGSLLAPAHPVLSTPKYPRAADLVQTGLASAMGQILQVVSALAL